MFESFNVIKEMVSVQRATIELLMHLGGLLSTQEATLMLVYTPWVNAMSAAYTYRLLSWTE